MKRVNEKTIRVILFIIFIAIVIIFAIKTKTKKDKEIPYAERENAAVEEAKSYINGKYGDVLTYSGVKEMTTGMVNGEAYWMVYFTDAEGETFSVQVFYDNEGAMYIEYETYYGYYIKDIMCEWMEEQLKETSLNEYILEYDEGKIFSPNWQLDYSAEEILNILSGETEGNISFSILIPENQRYIYDSGEIYDDLSKLLKYEDGLNIYIVIFSDDIFNTFYDDDNNRKRYIEDIFLF